MFDLRLGTPRHLSMLQTRTFRQRIPPRTFHSGSKTLPPRLGKFCGAESSAADRQQQAGLKGIQLGDSSISLVADPVKGLQYRGYSASVLSIEATFEEVAFLLIHGSLPDNQTLLSFRRRLSTYQKAHPELERVLELIPKTADPLDVLRIGTSFLEAQEVRVLADSKKRCEIGEGAKVKADELLVLFPTMIFLWMKCHNLIPQFSRIPMDSTFTIPDLIVSSLNLKEPRAVVILHRLMILYAEHDLNASTFAARVTASTGADFYSCVCSALSTLRGPIHGGALMDTAKLFSTFSCPKEAADWTKRMLAQKQLIPGFGHRVYRSGDPRAKMIKQWVMDLAGSSEERLRMINVAEAVEQTMLVEKDLRPNVDFYTPLLLKFLGMDESLFVALFAFSRLVGWSAHIIEQQENGKLIRPTSHYVGFTDLSYRRPC